MSTTFLISDDRERCVIDHIRAVFAESGHAAESRRITTGDYLIFRRLETGEAMLLAVVERKTLVDFAASLVDGRHANRENMLNARDASGAQVFYLIEGPAFPAPTRKFGRVPYRSIETAITNLSVRDQIHIVRSRDPLDSANKLLGLVRAFARLDEVALTRTRFHRGPDETTGAGEDRGPGETTGAEPVTSLAEIVPRELTEPVQISDHRRVVDMWSSLAGVSAVTAGSLAAAISFDQALSGLADFAEIKTPTGRALNARARRSLTRLAAGDRKETLQALSAVPGISKKVAAELLDTMPLKEMASAENAARLAELTLQQSTRRVRLGPKRAETIVRLLTWRLTRD